MLAHLGVVEPADLAALIVLLGGPAHRSGDQRQRG
jgi:hypothetical protein